MEGYNMESHDVGRDDIFKFPLLLFTLRNKKPESPLCASTVDLMNEILSRQNYITLAAQLDDVLDAENLLDFIRRWLCALSNQDLATVDMNRRAKRFMLAVISRMHDVPLSNIPYDPDSYTFPLLLTILRNKKRSRVLDSATIDMNGRAKLFELAVISKMCGEPQFNTPYDPHGNVFPSLFYILNNVELGYPLATNELAVNLMSEILSRKGDIYSQAGLHHNPRAGDLLKFILRRLNSHTSSDNAYFKGRANRFILEVTAKTRGISLSNSNTPHNSHSKIFQLITTILDSKQSQEDCMDIVAQLDHIADAKNLLDLILDRLFYCWMYPDANFMIQRKKLFLLKIMSKTYTIEPPPNPDDLDNYSFPLLLHILTYSGQFSQDDMGHPLMTELLRCILSREDYIDHVLAQLHKVSDAKDLLDFLQISLPIIDYVDDDYSVSEEYLSQQGSDMNLRGRRLTLAVFSKMHIVPSSNTLDDPDKYIIPLLLYTVKNSECKYVYGSIHDSGVYDLLCEVLSREDYVDLATQIDDPSPEASQILDHLLEMLLIYRKLGPNRTASSVSGREFTTTDITRRLRRFILKVISKIPIIPPSMIVTGVSIPDDRDYIGSGGFGRVFKGERSGEVVALKVLYKSENQVAFCREALMWRFLKHKFILPILGIHEIKATTPQIFLVSPYMKNGTLARWRKQTNPPIAVIEERPRKPWNTSIRKAQFMAISAGYYSTSDTLYYNANSSLQENVLLDDNFHVQIADFGLTRLSEATKTRSGALHLNFAAPELFGLSEDDEGSSDDAPSRTQMSDIYAFGCLYYEIHYDNIPFAGKSDLQILSLVFRGVRPPRLADQPLSDGAWDVIQRCWVREPLKRPSMNNVVQSMMAITISRTASQKRKRVHYSHDCINIWYYFFTRSKTKTSRFRKRMKSLACNRLAGCWVGDLLCVVMRAVACHVARDEQRRGQKEKGADVNPSSDSGHESYKRSSLSPTRQFAIFRLVNVVVEATLTEQGMAYRIWTNLGPEAWRSTSRLPLNNHSYPGPWFVWERFEAAEIRSSVNVTSKAMSFTFTIQSVKTGESVTYIGEEDVGAPVNTSSNPATLILSKNITDENISLVTIQGATGLYIAPDDDNKLVWSSTEYTWEVAVTAEGVYEIFPPGKNLFWAQDSSLVPDIELLTGNETTEEATLWNIVLEVEVRSRNGRAIRK
ncbi:hypothetical protein F5887DRAFT_918167 [Amanita rubescens]|nr:hypothetical protein F5887DRAFT_918167 [Amanita rubescens]